MRIVETYDPADAEYPGGRRWPAVAVLEDDGGFRWLIGHGVITEHHWRRALAAGAQGVLIPIGHGWHAASTERYTEIRHHGGQMTITGPDIPDLIDLKTQETTGPAPTEHPARAAFVNLHTHTEYSPMDGLSRIGQLVEGAVAQGAHALGVTDHGYCSGHPELQILAAGAGIKPVFGIEAYLVDDIAERGASNAYWHLILLARDDTGLRNLWSASTEAHRRGFYYKPRMDWDILARHAEGLIATTACLGGPVAQAILADDLQTAYARLARLQRIFEDRLYAEIHAYPTADQRKVNLELAEMAATAGVPLVAAADSHYPTRADHRRHQVWLACTTRKDLGESGMFTDGEFHLHTADDMRAALDYMPAEAVEQALASTIAIADAAEAEIRTRKVLPLSGPKATYDGDAKTLRERALANWSRVERRITDAAIKQAYLDRFEREMDLLVRQKFCGYYLTVADYVNWAKSNGILVGPGRGSGSGSLIAYLVGITEMDSVRWGLPFERFLTEGRTSLPDFDVDFPESKRGVIHTYLRSRHGENHVVSIGTVSRIRNRGVAKELERALRSTFPRDLAARSYTDMEQVSKIIEEAQSSNPSLSWTDLWAQHGDRLGEYRARYPELFDHADHMVGLLKTYGRHAAGVVISTGEPLTDVMPLRGGDDDTPMITQFDDDGVEGIGLIKYDILTLRNLDTIQHALDQIERRHGRRIDLYTLDAELDDPAVWDLICSGHTKGLFQIETALGAQWSRRIAPRSLPDLADVTTLVRPGPRDSGIAEAYARRRAGLDPITVPDERLTDVLAPTQGTMIYQEQVLAICRIIAGYNDAEADDVRKILGKKKVEAVDAAGRDFIARAIARGMGRNQAHMLWEQMAEFAKYAFGKAHAYAYALLCYWTAYLKTHYPVEYMAAVLSTVKEERIPTFVKECRRMRIPVLPPDINISGRGFTIDEGTVRYGLKSIDGIGEAAADEIIANQPYTGPEDLAERTGRAVTKGTIAILARAGAFDALVPHRAALVTQLTEAADGSAKRCHFKLDGLEEGKLPCGFDWASEPLKVNERTGKYLPRKDPPKRCTTACRQYTATGITDAALIPRYTPEQIGAIEVDLLGLYLTYSPFDRLDGADEAARAALRQAAEDAEAGAPGVHLVIAIVDEVRGITSKAGLPMGRITLDTEGPVLEMVIFSKLWSSLNPGQLSGALVAAEVECRPRGLNLKSIEIL